MTTHTSNRATRAHRPNVKSPKNKPHSAMSGPSEKHQWPTAAAHTLVLVPTYSAFDPIPSPPPSILKPTWYYCSTLLHMSTVHASGWLPQTRKQIPPIILKLCNHDRPATVQWLKTSFWEEGSGQADKRPKNLSIRKLHAHGGHAHPIFWEIY